MRRLITAMVKCQTELYKVYNGNEEFRDWLNGQMFQATYQTQETDRPLNLDTSVVDAEPS